MNQKEKLRIIKEGLGSVEGRQRLADRMMDPFKTSIGFTPPANCILIESELDCDMDVAAMYFWIVKGGE